MSAPPAASAPVDIALGFVDRVRRAWRLGWRAAGRGVIEFYNSDNLTFAASIAYYALLSFFPFVFLVFSLLSKVAVVQGGETLMHLIERALPSRFEFIGEQIKGLASAPVQVGVATTLLTLWASMGVFGAVTSAVEPCLGSGEAARVLQAQARVVHHAARGGAAARPVAGRWSARWRWRRRVGSAR